MTVISTKPSRLEAIEKLPREVRDDCLVDWPTVAIMHDRKDPEAMREWWLSQGLPVVDMGRRKLPRLKTVLENIRAREITPET